MKNTHDPADIATIPSGGSPGMYIEKSLRWILFLCIALVVADPAVANPLTERGIDPKVLDLMVSDLQAEVGYKRYTEIEITTEDDTVTDRALIRFDPMTDVGIDVTMSFEGTGPETSSVRQVRRALERAMRLQHQIRAMEFQYDPNSVEVESKDGDKAVILFRYRMFTMPQDSAWMRHLQGRLWIDGDRPTRIRLELNEGQAFFQDGSRVTAFETDANLIRLANGLDAVLDSETRWVTTSAAGLGTERTVTMNSTALAFTDPGGQDISPESFSPTVDVDLADFESEVRVKLDRKWPIWGTQARRAGFEVPKAFGVSVMYTDIKTNYQFTSFEINGETDLIEAIFDPNGSGLDVNAKAPQIRVDWFPVPFINLMAMYGEANAKGDLRVSTTPLGQILGLPEVIEGEVDTDTDLLTFGITVAAGYKNFFGNITAQATNATNSAAGVDAEVASVTAMAGYFFPRYRMRVMAGVEYFDDEQAMVGSIPLGGDEVLEFNVGMDQDAWAGRVGIYKEFGNHWEGNLTYTYGEDRRGLTVFFGYRF